MERDERKRFACYIYTNLSGIFMKYSLLVYPSHDPTFSYHHQRSPSQADPS